MATPQAFDLLPANNETHHPAFFNNNGGDEFRIMLLSDAAMAEELQLQEALQASLFTSELPNPSPYVKNIGESESSLSFCVICTEMIENEKLIKNGECGHCFCSDYCISKYLEAKIKEGFDTFPCPGFDCDFFLNFDDLKHLLPEDVQNLWAKAVSMEVAPNFSSRKDLCARESTEYGSERTFTANTSDNPSQDVSITGCKN
ncbi:uncharacterized protein LOC119369182 [Jatropha curcas]|uniref:uncharacterized protein LOC119369182 n=1 Tax=Jatropha curcas TaxID=180498 RepID=UPI0018930705|nr:uncharacterized protein LOC119369182 [Jatropha curcas]